MISNIARNEHCGIILSMRLLMPAMLFALGSVGPATEGMPIAILREWSGKKAFIDSVSQQTKRFWHAPGGADSEKLVTTLRLDINQVGEVVGEPQVLSVDGVTDKNRKLVPRHVANAIEAVRRAAPFQPPVGYRHIRLWKGLTLRFDRKVLSDK